MQKAPVMKGSGLKPLDDSKSSEEVHVFGRNLEERVVTKDEEESPSISFNSIQNNQNPDEDDIDSIRKRKFDAITGEEDEETIFQGDFKLFVWDLATSNWIEKGRGQLRLNDSIDQDEKKSRIIMRVSGTLRIILNVAINRSFFKVIANSKNNIRFTDSQTVWAASGSNAHQLRDLIDERLEITSEEEEENELRKKTKSEAERAPPKKTKADSDKTESSPSKTSENVSTQKDSDKNEVVRSESDSKDGQTHQFNDSGDRDSNHNEKSDAQKDREDQKGGEEEERVSDSVEERDSNSNSDEKSSDDSDKGGER